MAMRTLNVPVSSRPSFKEIEYLLKDGNLQEFKKQKDKIISDWENNRYRICVECGEKKNRLEFIGESKRCASCNINKKKQAKTIRKEYLSTYKNTEIGKQIHCSKQVVYYMKKMGVLKQNKCEICGEEITQAHHDDYNFPYKVRWLCNKHHNDWHIDNKPKYVGE